jgi:hypothetical protein
MKTTSLIFIALIALPGFMPESASAAVAARRSAVVVQGPYGGTAVAASRTAIVGRRYGFLPADDSKETAANPQQATDARHAKACDADLNNVRLVKAGH